jgi:hypothetical protein
MSSIMPTNPPAKLIGVSGVPTELNTALYNASSEAGVLVSIIIYLPAGSECIPLISLARSDSSLNERNGAIVPEFIV